ncbi:hypothetical protein LPMP_330400 [Leishmania panamensis]|uniref:Uncharacterized protein n=1 Tax=Leishmania panamensis TaxID=5679 RepID=A0A088RYV7_LEIPA|nr:hypothetical protein LPMP_330400 [Leishmania panamensis]AIO01333.1 hypothetical protein LPMP_330400 [Leishmania panamensis]
MSDLRAMPGYAEMKDYYNGDYVPYDLLTRYDALQLELRKRREQHFVTLSQASDVAMSHDGLAATSTLPQLAVNSPYGTRRANEHQQQVLPWSLRSPHRATRHRSGSWGKGDSGGQRANRRGSIHRCILRPSMELEDIYAARQSSPSCIFGASSPTQNSFPLGSSARHIAPSSASTSHDGADAVAQPPTALSSSALRRHRQLPKHRSKPLAKAYSGEPSPGDPYEAAAEARRQEQFLSESKRLGKPFVPSGSSGLDVPTRFMLGDCVRMLYRSIAPEWRVATPVVVSTAEDLVAVYFSLDKLSKEQVTALLQYMNASLKYNTAVREFHLSKVDEGWDVLTNDGYVLYTFRPPWVKKRVFLPDTITPPHAHV